MLKPIYGLKDAARAWRMKLHEVITGWSEGLKALTCEPELYAAHHPAIKGSERPARSNTLAKAQKNEQEQLDAQVDEDRAGASAITS